MSKITISSRLKNDIKNLNQEYCNKLAQKVSYDLTNETQTAIIKFYTSWSPKYYNRHYYNFMENSFKRYYKNPHNSVYYGGVELTPYNMEDIYGSKNKSTGANLSNYIFNLVYSGYHGNMKMISSSYNVEIMNPSPLNIILDRRDYIINNVKEYSKDIINSISKESYKTLF